MSGAPARYLRAVRGRLLTPLPQGGVRDVRDGLLVFRRDGTIVHAGKATRTWARAEAIGGGARAMVVAAFWDPHVHLPQLELAGRHREPLLAWLERRVFPAEAGLRDPRRAAQAAERFFRALGEAGTAGAGVFGAPFPAAAAPALETAAKRRIPVRLGPALMDLGPPELAGARGPLLQGLQRLAGRFGTAVAVAPRFALSCSRELLAACGRIARARRAFVFTHLAETRDEVREVERRFGRSYTEVYDEAGLLGPRTLLGHGIHLSRAELALIARRRSWLVHCPTSNEALGSGRMPLEEIRRAGVRWCLASDVGAGPDLCLLDVIESFLRVHKGRARTTAAEAYRRATIEAARALGFRRRGSLVPGYRADFLLIDHAPRGARSAEGLLRRWLHRGARGRWNEIVGRLHRDGRPVGDPGSEDPGPQPGVSTGRDRTG